MLLFFKKLVYNLFVKKILLLSLLIFTFILCIDIQANEVNNGLQFYYIRARDFKKTSSKVRTEAGKILVEKINNAQKTIDFAFYGLSKQDDILNALVNAQKRGVNVRGIVDKNIENKNDYSGTEDAIQKLGTNIVKTDYKTEIEKLNKINNKEIDFNYDFFKGHIMHNKFCIIDNEIVWTGTVNISSTGTGGFNENNACLIHSKEVAKLFEKEFEQMYIKELFHENKQPIYSKKGINVDDKNIQIYFSPNKFVINNVIVPEIEKAQEYIYLSMFLITNNKIVQSLIDAHNRGVEIKLIVDAHHALQPYSKHQQLRDAGIKVKVENWAGKMHAKTVLIDDHTIISGSANWTYSAFKYNDENLLVFKNVPNEVNFLKKEFLKSWNSIPNKWLYKNPQPEGKDSKYSCSDGVDNDHNGLFDKEDPACQ